ncbi:hypothetical protein ACFLS1_10535 [Verrucomicrobiota bacterium]
MMVIGTLAFLVWIVTAFIVTVDMFRKRTAIGCLGLVLFAVLPFIWVLKWYSGRRSVVCPVLYVSAIVAVVCFSIGWRSAAQDLNPFFHAASEESGLRCSLQSIGFKGGMKQVVVVSVPIDDVTIEYANVDDMVQGYRERFVDSLTNDYPQALIDGSKAAIILAIPTPSGFYACYRIESPGKITKAWHDSGEDL